MPSRIVQKRRKPLKRKPIRARGKFKAFGSNPFRKYKRKRTDEEVTQYALRCRQERLRNRTRAEIAFAQTQVIHQTQKPGGTLRIVRRMARDLKSKRVYISMASGRGPELRKTANASQSQSCRGWESRAATDCGFPDLICSEKSDNTGKGYHEIFSADFLLIVRMQLRRSWSSRKEVSACPLPTMWSCNQHYRSSDL